jgi:hypothetical protein
VQHFGHAFLLRNHPVHHTPGSVPGKGELTFCMVSDWPFMLHVAIMPHPTLAALCRLQGRILLQADQSGAPDMVMMAPAPGPLPEGPLPEGSTNELCGGYCQLDMDCKCPGEVCKGTIEYGVLQCGKPWVEPPAHGCGRYCEDSTDCECPGEVCSGTCAPSGYRYICM